MHIKKGPWTVTGTKQMYQNPWMSVREDAVIRPDGKPGIYGVTTILDGVSILALEADNTVYLTKEYHYAVERVTYETFNGGIEGVESHLEAAQRELKEESGIEADEMIYLGFIDPFTSLVKCVNHLYLARGLRHTNMTNREGTETAEIILVPFHEAFEYVMQSKVTHSASAAVILKTKAYLEGSKK